MAKKTKKQQQAEGQTTGQIKKEKESMETQTENQEAVPPTIVETTESELFAQGQEVVPATELPPESNQNQPVVQPESKPQRVNKRPYIQEVQGLLESGTHSRAEIIAFVLQKYPSVSKGGIQTFVTDLRNPKYSHFKDRKVVLYGSEGKLIFEDKVSAIEAPSQSEAATPVEAASNDTEPTEVPAEQPAK